MNSGAGTMAAFCNAQKCRMAGQRHRTFGALQTVSRSVKPFECWDLDTLQGFNSHKVLNTHILKNRMLEKYEKPQLCLSKNVCSWASFSNVTMMVLKAVKYGLCSIKPSFVVCFLFFFFKFPFMFVVHLDH